MVHSVGPGIWNDNIVLKTDTVSNMFPAIPGKITYLYQ